MEPVVVATEEQGHEDLVLPDLSHAKIAVGNAIPAQELEWIPHDDKTARKRARAHVTRGFRRQKAAEAAKANENEKVTLPNRRNPSVTKSQETSQVTPPHLQKIDSSSTAKDLIQGLVLQRSLPASRIDPFAAFPVSLDSSRQALLDHFFFGVAPVSYSHDNRADFSPVKTLSFNVALSDPSAFHVILSAAASDIAALRGRRDSEDAIRHRSAALSLVNKNIMQWQPNSDDNSLAGIALLAGNELLFGTPSNFKTHMQGLASLLNMKGGLESLRYSNPQLYAIISWFDYSGSCNLLAKRRFTPIRYSPELLHSPLDGVPELILRGLPKGYDLYKELIDLIEGLQTVTSVMTSRPNTLAPTSSLTGSEERSAFITAHDSALYTSICDPEQEGNRTRRRYVMQSFHLLVLIYTTLISGYEGPASELFLYRFEKALIKEVNPWGGAMCDIFRSLLAGMTIELDLLALQVSQLVDICVVLEWASWRRIKRQLLEFLVWDRACKGGLQELWRHRMENLERYGSEDSGNASESSPRRVI